MTLVADPYAVFPECPGFGFTVEPRYLAKAIEREGGQERVDRRWDRPLVFFTAVPTGNRDADIIQNLLIFWHSVSGTFGRFRFKDWTDYKSCFTTGMPTALDQPMLDMGDGTFQLIKRYTAGPMSQDREIYRPIGSTILVANESGITQTDWSLDEATGLLTPGGGFSGTPTTWGGEFDLPCRFLTEYSVTVVDGKDIQSGSFTLREVRPTIETEDSGGGGGGSGGGGGGGGSGSPLTALWPDPLPDGEVGLIYSFFLTASGGVPPYTFGISSGSLPAELSLDTATGEISSSGIPLVTDVTITGITFSVTDSAP